MTAAPLHLMGERLLLDPLGAVVWPEEHLVAVADLHLEKGSAAARRGQLVPPWDTEHTLDRLHQEGAERAKIMAIAIHPYISGQPHRIRYLEQVFDNAAGRDGVVFMNGAEILDWFTAASPHS